MEPTLGTGTLNIAVAGLGRMGKRHARTLMTRVRRANLVAVCSTDDSELAWARHYFAGHVKVYSSYAEMINHPDLQAVWVSTSTNVHAQQTLDAIAKNLHVLCEKPLALSLEEVSTGGRNHW